MSPRVSGRLVTNISSHLRSFTSRYKRASAPGSISASVSGNNNIHYKAFAEDDTSFAANKVGRGQRTFNAQFVLEFADDPADARFIETIPGEGYRFIAPVHGEG